jgi:hypothetical protein
MLHSLQSSSWCRRQLAGFEWSGHMSKPLTLPPSDCCWPEIHFGASPRDRLPRVGLMARTDVPERVRKAAKSCCDQRKKTESWHPLRPGIRGISVTIGTQTMTRMLLLLAGTGLVLGSGIALADPPDAQRQVQGAKDIIKKGDEVIPRTYKNPGNYPKDPTTTRPGQSTKSNPPPPPPQSVYSGSGKSGASRAE